jgi:chaperone BCS1
VPIKVKYSFINNNQWREEKIHIQLTKLGRSHKLFDELKADLQLLVEKENETEKLSIYNYNKKNIKWQQEVKIRKRNFSTIFIEDDIMKRILNHLDNFYAREEWYHEREIPYQTGICLHGPAGTGKTSIVKGLASHYNKNLCILRPSEINHLPDALKHLPLDSFIVIEDIDTSSIVIERNPEESIEDAIQNRLIGESSNGPEDKENNEFKEGKVQKEPSYTKVYLSDILNAMDGFISIEKRVIIFTTNHIDKIDRALIRPGRIDCIERIDYISFTQFIRFCNIFYKDKISKEYRDSLFSQYSGLKHNVTVAELQRDFMQGMTFDEMLQTHCK